VKRDAAHASKAEELIAAHREYMLQSLTTYYQEPLVLEEGSGSRVWDADGREYLDAFGGILTTSLGHCHPRLVEAVREQLGKLGHVSTLYLTEPMLEGARRLADLAPGALKRTFFSNSGSEAVETAIGIARAFTGRTEVIALRGAYHGRSAGAVSLTAPQLVARDPVHAGGRRTRARAVPVSLSVPPAVRRALRGRVRARPRGGHPHRDERSAAPRSSPRRSRG
jgi:4-aminobutyrate aminotransferase-like enzyme